MNTVIYSKLDGSIIDVLDSGTKFPSGLTNPDNTYGEFVLPEGATNISECTKKVYNNRIDIIADIFESVSNEAQLDIIMDAMDKYTTFMLALDAKNWTVARLRLAKALTSGDITQAEYDLVNGKIPQ